jgi:transposase-like protein
MAMTTRKRHSAEQVVRKLATADRILGEGKDIADVCRELGVSEQTYYRWRHQFGGLKANDAKRLKELERENSTLKRLLADAELEKAALNEIAKETSKPGTPAGGRAPPHRRDGCVAAVRQPGDRAEPNHPAPSARRSESCRPRCGLRAWLRQYAKEHPRRGFRPAYHDARAEGWTVNHKKIQRLWREEGLRVPQRRRRKRVGTSTAPEMPTADAPNRVWAVDFQFDATADGRPIKIVSIIDEHTRECLGGLVDRQPLKS